MQYILQKRDNYRRSCLLLYLSSDSIINYDQLYKEIILLSDDEDLASNNKHVDLLEFYGVLLERMLNYYSTNKIPTSSLNLVVELGVRKFLFLCSIVEYNKNHSCSCSCSSSYNYNYNNVLLLMLRLILSTFNNEKEDSLIDFILHNFKDDNNYGSEFVFRVGNEVLFIDYVKNIPIAEKKKKKKELLYNILQSGTTFGGCYELLLVLFRDTKEYSLLLEGILLSTRSYNQMILVRIYSQLYNNNNNDDDDDDELSCRVDGIPSLEQVFKGIVKEYYFPSTIKLEEVELELVVEETVVLLYNLLLAQLNNSNVQVGNVIVLDQDDSGSEQDFSNCLKVVDLLEYLIPFENIGLGLESTSVLVPTRSLNGKKGLVNLGATCYMNSLLQQLFYIKGFRDKVLNYDVDSLEQEEAAADSAENKNSKELLKQLQWLFMQLKYSLKGYVSTEKFAQQCAFYNNNNNNNNDSGEEEKNVLNVNQQMDVDEYYNLLFDRLERFNLVQDLFRGQHEMKIQSKHCQHCSKRLELFYSLQLNVLKVASMKESLQQEYSSEEMLQDENQYKCEQCQPARKVDAAKTLRLKQLPPVLFVSLKRFEFDFQRMVREKVNDSFEFYAEMDLGEYCCDQEEEEEAAAAADVLMGAGVKRERENSVSSDDASSKKMEKKQLAKYRLKGVLVHIGTADSGHYYSYVQDRDTGLWWLFNDAQVFPYDPQDIPKDCFGGGNYSAYILVYEKVLEQEQNVAVKHSETHDRLKQKVMEDNYKYGIQLLVNDQRMYSLVDGILKNITRDCKVPKKLLQFMLKFRFFVLSALNSFASRALMTRVETAILEAVSNNMEHETELIQFITSNSSRVGLARNSEFLSKLLKQLQNKSPLPAFLNAMIEAANLVLCNDILEALPQEDIRKFVDANVKGRIKDLVETVKSIEISSVHSKEGLSGTSTPANTQEHSECSEVVKFLYLLREFLPVQMIGSIVSVLIRMKLPFVYEVYHVGLVAFYFLARYVESNEAEDACFIFDVLQSDSLHEINMKILFSAQSDVLYQSDHDLDARNFLVSLLGIMKDNDDIVTLKSSALKFLTDYESPDLTEELYSYAKYWILTYLGQYQQRQVRVAAFNLANRLFFTEQDGHYSVPALTTLLVSRMKKFIIYDSANDGNDFAMVPHIEQYCKLLCQCLEYLIKTKSIETELIVSVSERYELLFFWIKEFLDHRSGANFRDLFELVKLLRLILFDVDAEGLMDFMVENHGSALLLCDLPIRSSYNNVIIKFNQQFVPEYYWLLADIIQESAKLDYRFCNYLCFCLATQSKSLQHSITEYLGSKDELDVSLASSILEFLIEMIDKYIFIFMNCIQAGNLRSVYQDLRRIRWPEFCDPIIHTYAVLCQESSEYLNSCRAQVTKRKVDQIEDRALKDDMYKSVQVLEFLRLVGDYIDLSKSDNGD